MRYALLAADGRYVSKRSLAYHKYWVFTNKPHMVLVFDTKREAEDYRSELVQHFEDSHNHALTARSGYGNYVNADARREGEKRLQFYQAVRVTQKRP